MKFEKDISTALKLLEEIRKSKKLDGSILHDTIKIRWGERREVPSAQRKGRHEAHLIWWETATDWAAES